MKIASQKIQELYTAKFPTQDPAQLDVLAHFERLKGELETPRRWWFFQWKKAPPKGIYLWGSVGRGKTCLMDLFYTTLQGISKERVHFHAFMEEVHTRVSKIKSLDAVADEIASRIRLLCFDEFQVTNIADAMIMSRFFGRLFEKGVVMVMTSNVEPTALYRKGLNREHFLPFIDLLHCQMEIVHMGAGRDYRKDTLPPPPHELVAHWNILTAEEEETTHLLKRGQRTLPVARAKGNYAWFSFEELCALPLGVRDYLLLSQHYKGVFIENLPTLSPEDRNEAHRLMTLVDVLYERKIPLYYPTMVEPDALYPEGEGAQAFERTASRLYEMRKWYDTDHKKDS